MSDFIHSIQMEDTSLCDDLLKYYGNNAEYKHRGLSDGGDKKSTDVVVWPNSSDPSILRYLDFLRLGVDSYRKKYDSFTFPLGFAEPWLIQHYEPGEGFTSWHCERASHQTHQRALVFMTYLNDVEDGGETQWLYQGRQFKPKKGLTAIWPTDFTHTHRGVVSPTQRKTIATGWFSFLDFKSAHGDLTKYYEEQISDLRKEIKVKNVEE